MSTEANFKYNILTFDHIAEPVAFSFYKEKEEGRFPISKSELPINISDCFDKNDLNKLDFLYTDFKLSPDGAGIISVDLKKSIRFAKYYYSFLICEFFKKKAYLIETNFIGDVTAYFHLKSSDTKDYAYFEKYTFKVQIARVTEFPELVIAYSGSTKILKKNLVKLESSQSDFTKVVYNKQIHKLDDLIHTSNPDRNNIYPVLNLSLKNSLNIVSPIIRTKNKYLLYFNNIQSIYKDYINTDEFKAIIPINCDNFITVASEKIFHSGEKNQNLVYGNNNIGKSPMSDMYKYGPFKSSSYGRVEFFIIYHIDDINHSQRILDSFNNGIVGWKGMRDFAKLNFYFPVKNTFAFTNINDPLPEIKNYLSNFEKTPGTNYLCIFLNPIEKDIANQNQNKIYYKVKAELLKNQIVCQTIKKSTILSDSYKFSLRNLGIAIIAKLKGIPWCLESEIANELIVGVGAFHSKTTKGKYIGSAFCFSNDGQFEGFNCYSAKSSKMLAGSIREAIEVFIEKHDTINRLIIHFYKIMSYADVEEIQNVLRSVKQDIPIIVITVNKSESKDILIFDDSVKEKIPESGSFFNIGKNQYLLCNNSRYGSQMPVGIEGFPFPIKLTFWASDPSIAQDSTTVHELINQVYQFSRLYWKSVTQQSLPVTVKYPEMVAEMFPNFDLPALPEFGKETLWFL
ncbi:MAG TPA: Piwi domain-containing protein [Bacteroidales bacterium]|nr:Piwi domain-containing protein [Bacteroidales bacterium]